MNNDDRHKTPANTGIEIDVEKIKAVLLSDNQWYEVDSGTFEVAAGIHFSEYQYIDNQAPWFTFMKPHHLHGGGKRQVPMSGPLSSIKAFRCKP